jgi:hypothetical protein
MAGAAAMTTHLVFDQKEVIGQWVAEQTGQVTTWGDFYAMGAVNETHGIVAGLVFNNFNNSNATTHIVVARPGKYLKGLFNHAYDYAFNCCKLNRLTGLTPASNHKALRLNKHVGWEVEYIMPKGAPDGEDMVVQVMWPEKFIYRSDDDGR